MSQPASNNSTSSPTNCSLFAQYQIDRWPFGPTDFFLQHYVFPVQFTFGVLGNTINLIVLLSSANILLSAMAFADIGLLFCMLPRSLITFTLFHKSLTFSHAFYAATPHLFAFANMFSTAANFFVLAVSLERFSGVRKPMHTRFQLRERRLYSLIFGIFALAFFVNFSNHIEYSVNVIETCNHVQPKNVHIKSTNAPEFLKMYVAGNTYLQVVVIVIFPVVAVAILNISLIYFLRQRQNTWHKKSTASARADTHKNGGGTNSVVQETCEIHFSRYSDIGGFQKRERKVTITVLAIVTCFTIAHIPTLIPVIWEKWIGVERKARTYHNISTVTNSLVITGKVLNFFLFCLSSTHFRKRAFRLFSNFFRKMCNQVFRKKYSIMTTSGHTAQSLTLVTTACPSDRSDPRFAHPLIAMPLLTLPPSARNRSSCSTSSFISSSNGSYAPSNHQQKSQSRVSLQHRSATTNSSDGAPTGYRMTRKGTTASAGFFLPRERTISTEGSASLDNAPLVLRLSATTQSCDEFSEEQNELLLEDFQQNIPLERSPTEKSFSPRTLE